MDRPVAKLGFSSGKSGAFKAEDLPLTNEKTGIANEERLMPLVATCSVRVWRQFG